MAGSFKGIELTPYDDIFSTEAERQERKQERIVDIPLEQLHPYERQPYAVDRKTPDLARLMDSIEENGINTPLIVRPREAGGYEILSGHRRNYCAGVLGLQALPAIVRNMDDDKADELVVDANINREDLLPSEKAKAYKLKLYAMKRQGARTDLTSSQLGMKFENKQSMDILADQVKESRMQIHRYVRLTNLIPPLLEKVDRGVLKFVPASEYISHLTETEQSMLNAVMERDEVSPSMGQAQRLKQLSAMGMLDEAAMDALMATQKVTDYKVTLRSDTLSKYFPRDWTPRRMEETITKLLEDWHRKRTMDRSR